MFKVQPAGKQRRFEGKRRLVPDVDWGAYEASIVVDTMTLHAILGRRTQARYLRDALIPVLGESVYVKPAPGENPSSCRAWLIQIQEPTRKAVKAAVEALGAAFGLERGEAITRLDVALDLKPKRPDGDALITALNAVVATFLPPPEHREPGEGRDGALVARAGLRRGRNRGAVRQWSGVVGAGHTRYWGHEAETEWRCYLKVEDQGEPLPVDQHRVRLEVSLDEAELAMLGLKTLKDLEVFEWRRLSPYFRFWCPVVRQNWQAESPMLEWWAKNRNAVMLGAGKKNWHVVAYGSGSEQGLNRVVEARLRRFTW